MPCGKRWPPAASIPCRVQSLTRLVAEEAALEEEQRARLKAADRRGVRRPRLLQRVGSTLPRMDFAFSDRCLEYRDALLTFMEECIYPNEGATKRRSAASGNPHHHPEVMEELKQEARGRGLWNLFQPHQEWGPGLTNLEYAPLAEIMGRSTIASEACNCSAPDTGNMEILTMFGTHRAAGPVATAAAGG